MLKSNRIARTFALLATIVGAVESAAAKTKKIRAYAPLAAFELGIYRNARFNVAHGPDALTRVHSTEDAHFLMHVMGRDHALHKYAVPIAPRETAVAGVVVARPSRHFPDAVYPSLTPWVTVHFEHRTATPTTLGDQKAWKDRRAPHDDQRITLAIARRLIMVRERVWAERAVRLQREFTRKAGGRAIAITLLPADVEGRYAAVRVDQNAATGVLRLDPLFGDILGFTADARVLTVLASNGREYDYRVDARSSALSFVLLTSREVPPGQYRPEYRHLDGVTREVKTRDEAPAAVCEPAIVDEVLSSETASD